MLDAVPSVQQNWATGLDSSGQRILVTDSARERLGSLVYPGNVGGTNWWSPSYDPALELMFVPRLEQGMIFFSSTSSWPQPNGRAAEHDDRPAARRRPDQVLRARV